MGIGVMWNKPTIWHQIRYIEISRPKNKWQPESILHCIYIEISRPNYIRNVKTPNDAWGNLKKIFATSMTVRKLQLRQEPSNFRQRDMSVADYTSKIKEICDLLGSINVTTEEDEVQVCLGDLAQKF